METLERTIRKTVASEEEPTSCCTCCLAKICRRLAKICGIDKKPSGGGIGSIQQGDEDDETTPLLNGSSPNLPREAEDNGADSSGTTSSETCNVQKPPSEPVDGNVNESAECNVQKPPSEPVDGNVNESAEPNNTPKMEKIEVKEIGIGKVDDSFNEFQAAFNSFYECQEKMEKAVKEFKTAIRAGEFGDCLKEFERRLPGKKVQMKKLVLNFSKAVLKSEDSVGSAATALTKILEAYSSTEKLPVRVINKSISCLKDAMQLDPAEMVNEEFSGSVFDLGKIPKQIIDMRENIKQVKKAPGIVSAFFQYFTSIVMDIINVFGNVKIREIFPKKTAQQKNDLKQACERLKKEIHPEPPKEVKFTSLGIPSLDQIFNDVAKIINPVSKLSNDLFEARKKLEEAIKAISEFREDKSKAFNDYLDELKQRIKNGDIHIIVSVKENHIEVDKVEGLEPNVMKNIESGLKAVIKSGTEIEDLGPDTTKKLIPLWKDVCKVSITDIKSHVSFKEVPSKVSALNENVQKAKKIPDILKFLLCFIRHLLMDVREILHSKKTEESQNDPDNENPSSSSADGN